MIGRPAELLSATKHRMRDRRFLFDLTIAALLTVLTVVEAAAVDVPAGQSSPDAVAYALIVVAGVSLLWRRFAPIAVLSVVTAAMIAFWLSDYSSFLALVGLPALYAVATYCENRRRAWVAILVASVAMMTAAGVSILNPPDGFKWGNAINMTAYIAVSIAVGVVVRNRVKIFADAQRRADEAEADRLAEAQRAVAVERSRIAREMHDVVAHGMSAIAVQAAAAQEIVHTNPDKAAEVLANIENVGRESLSEMRRMLGVLRDSGESGDSLAPQPTMSDLPRAISQSADSGVAAELEITGDERDLPPGIELAAFRIVQEALTNVRKHGGESATVVVSINYGDDILKIEVSDDGAGAATSLSRSGSGNGLIGMRERIEIYNGEFDAGPAPGGGYVVRAELPITDADTRPGVTSATSNPAEISP